MEIRNLLNKEFKVVIIKLLNELGRRMDEYNETFNKELENTKKNQKELKNMIPEIKNIPERINSRLYDIEEKIGEQISKYTTKLQ